MSIAAPARPAPPPRLVEQTFEKRRRHARMTRDRVTPAALFVVAFAAYLTLGWWVTLHLHVLPGDGLSRLTHAYDVFWNVPAKLSAIGFVWPPLMTISFLPFAAVKPLATSFWALPLMTALFGAGLLVVLERALAYAGMAVWQRLSLVLLFGANPMIAHYASNGMAEISALWFLTIAAAAFIRWHVDGQSRELVVAAILFALGTLIRYEIALWAFLFAAAVAFLVARCPRRRIQIEASAVTLLAPVVYALGVWVFVNWTIIGHPFAWVHEETTQTFVWTRTGAVGNLGHISVGEAARIVGEQYVRLFPLVFAVAAVLLVVGVARRARLALIFGVALLLNAALTIVLAVAGQTPHVFGLRFNTRALPLVLLGVALLYRMAQGRARLALWAVTAAALAASIPLTWHTMATYPYQLDERPFTRALATGRDQARLIAGIDPIADERMAAYIRRNVHADNAILTDDANTFGVILRTGHPEWFVDRIDRGDDRWFTIARAPRGHVHYLLFSAVANDFLTRVYPHAYARGGRGLRLVQATRTSRLYRLIRRR